jgi:NadR type nicotinamide-nucleotide adenylyltransferase
MKKIVVLGPESTGKSTLCAGLAAHYNTLWVPEAAREYLVQNGMNYSYTDLLHIARQQQQLEEQYAARLQQSVAIGHSTPVPLIIDTNQYVMKVWCEVVFDKCHAWILDKAASASYDLYLLCNTDLPWVQDGLREYPDMEQRRRLFLQYKDIVINDGTPWAIISGEAEARLKRAVDAIDAILK